MSSSINYAKAVGIESLAGAIIFTILYIPLFLWFVRKSFVHPTHVHYTLTFFCTIRVVAFAIRAVLTTSVSSAENLGLVIADEALFAIGYFSLIYSAYNLVLDRILLSDPTPPNNPILRITQNRRLFRVAILLGLILGIVSSSTTNSNGSSSTSGSLHIASTVIFLVVTILQAVQTIYLASKHVSRQHPYLKQGKNNSLGVRYGNYILLIISLLLLVRESFATATVKNNAKQSNEHFWYPLLAVPEFLAVVLFTAPGLVPRKDEVAEYVLTDTTPQYATPTPYATTPYATAPYDNTTTPYAPTPYAAPAAPYNGTPHYTA